MQWWHVTGSGLVEWLGTACQELMPLEKGEESVHNLIFGSYLSDV